MWVMTRVKEVGFFSEFDKKIVRITRFIALKKEKKEKTQLAR